MATAIIIGASSGIGREIAVQLCARGFRVGVAARNQLLLKELSETLGAGNCVVRDIDISKPDQVRDGLNTLRQALGSVDYVYLVAGTGFVNRELQYSLEEQTVAVNCVGFAAVATMAVQIFREQGRGHLVAVTSVAAVRPSGEAPSYGASKAFGSSYVEALRYWVARRRLPLFLTEVRPGFVDTAMMQAAKPFWVISPAEAAAGIIKAVDKQKRLVYIPSRWWFVAQLLKVIPDWLYTRMG